MLILHMYLRWARPNSVHEIWIKGSSYQVTLEPSSYTNEKYGLSCRYQKHVHDDPFSIHTFRNFLVESCLTVRVYRDRSRFRVNKRMNNAYSRLQSPYHPLLHLTSLEAMAPIISYIASMGNLLHWLFSTFFRAAFLACTLCTIHCGRSSRLERFVPVYGLQRVPSELSSIVERNAWGSTSKGIVWTRSSRM